MAPQTLTQTGHVVWHELSTPSAEKSASFYTSLLGWQTETFKPGEMDYTMISVGGATHGGFQQADDGRPSFWFGHIAVEDVDAAAAKATKLGAETLAGPMDIPEVGRFTLIRDPQGAVCSLYTPAGEGPAATGVFAWDELMSEDVEASRRFYTEVAGWRSKDMDMSGMTYTMFQAADGQDVAGLMAKPEMAPTSAWLTYLANEDTDASVKKAESLGATTLAEPFDITGIGRIAILVDPAGAAFGLFQSTAT
ncbi:MAG: VOC family protein [Gaiella sp.]